MIARTASLAAALVVVAVGASACASTAFKSTWKDPTAQPVTLHGQKVAAFMITPIETARRSGEDTLARELRARGVQGIPGYQLTGDKPMRDSEALRRFVSFYGREAGDFALKLMARGGVYLGGGIAPRILPALREGAFLAGFLDKGRMRPLLESMPVRVVLNDQTGLLGAGRCAAFRARG